MPKNETGLPTWQEVLMGEGFGNVWDQYAEQCDRDLKWHPRTDLDWNKDCTSLYCTNHMPKEK